MEIHVLSCPYCAAQISSRTNICEYCGHEYMISSFSSFSKIGRSDASKYTTAYSSALKENPTDPSLNVSIGICYFSLGLYDKALDSFEKVVTQDPEMSFGYFAAALSMLGGKTPFLIDKKRIDKAIEYLNAAILIDNRALYHYLMAYIKRDYYKRKCLRTVPDFEYHFAEARSLELSVDDRYIISEIMKWDLPV